jgi:hypothetical protein
MPLRHSYAGRHAEPTPTAHRAIKTTAVIGAGLGLGSGLAPLLGTVPANAAGGSPNWTGVAQCESSGDWSINTGNGFYGGLQFTESTWLGYGGGHYAQYANEATEAEQIVIADRVLAGQGIGAWPVCGKYLSYGGTTAQGEYQAPAQQQSPVQTTSYVGRHRAEDYGKTIDHGRVYVVGPGDSLSAIAEAHHVRGGWRHLYEINRKVIGSNPDQIYAGQHLRLPHHSR